MPKKKLNILFVTPHFPYPMIGGERVKQFHILKHLSKSHRIILVSLDRNFEIKNEYIHEIEKLGIEVWTYHLKKINSLVTGSFFTLFRYPIEVEFFRHSKMSAKIDEIVKTENIDLIINFFIRTAEFVKAYEIPKILIAEDCRSKYQENTYKNSKNIVHYLYRFRESRKLKLYEAKITNFFDCITLVTNEDLNDMQTLNPNASYAILSNGVDIDKFMPPEEPTIRKDLLFTGKLDVWLNRMMVKELVEHIFPQILKEMPEIKLNIAGSNPGKDIQNYASDSVRIFSDPDNLNEFYQHAAIYLHPQHGGSGIQNKLLEALSCGCPVITTIDGARGVSVTTEVNAIIAGSREEFVHYTKTMINSQEIPDRIGIEARKLIEDNYTWNKIYNKMDEIIDMCLS